MIIDLVGFRFEIIEAILFVVEVLTEAEFTFTSLKL